MTRRFFLTVLLVGLGQSANAHEPGCTQIETMVVCTDGRTFQATPQKREQSSANENAPRPAGAVVNRMGMGGGSTSPGADRGSAPSSGRGAQDKD